MPSHLEPHRCQQPMEQHPAGLRQRHPAAVSPQRPHRTQRGHGQQPVVQLHGGGALKHVAPARHHAVLGRQPFAVHGGEGVVRVLHATVFGSTPQATNYTSVHGDWNMHFPFPPLPILPGPWILPPFSPPGGGQPLQYVCCNVVLRRTLHVLRHLSDTHIHSHSLRDRHAHSHMLRDRHEHNHIQRVGHLHGHM